jgi:hypothetical protein
LGNILNILNDRYAVCTRHSKVKVSFVRMPPIGRSEPIDSQIIALNKAIIGQAALELSGVIDSERVAAWQSVLQRGTSGWTRPVAAYRALSD